MNSTPGPDLLLIDDETELFRSRPVPPGSGGRYSPDSSLLNLAITVFRWAMLSPKLAVPLLAAYSRAAGHRVEAIYRPFLPWQLRKFRRLLSGHPLVAGITTVAMFEPEFVARITSEIRRLSPGTVIVLGGHGAADCAEIRALGDLFISDHGEWQLAKLVTELKKGVQLSEVTGVEAAPGGGLAMRGSLRYEGMPQVLAPDWTAASTISRRYPVEASRGCRFSCAFCGFPGRAGQSFREPAEVAREMLGARKSRGIRRFEFVDSSLTSDPGFVRALCGEIRSLGLRADWHCFARPDAFARDERLADEMAAAGCSRVFMGIESIHDPILAAMRRGMDRKVVELGLSRVFGAGIKVHGNFIIGFPGETEATVAETAEFVRSRPFLSAAFCTLGVSTELLAIAAAEPERYLHLAGAPVKNWRHDGMDYRGAYELTLKAVAGVNAGRRTPVASSPRTNDPAYPPF